MDDKTAWDVYFAGIASIRFHPANDANTKDNLAEVKKAAAIANMMINERRRQWRGSEGPSQSEAPYSAAKDNKTPTTQTDK